MKTYSEYKNSGIEWLGDIPKHWEVKKLNSVCKYLVGGTPPTGQSDSFNGTNKWLNISDISDNSYIFDTEQRISDKAIKDNNILLSPKGSLLFSFKLSIGQVGFAGVDLYTNEAVATFLSSSKINLNYAYYMFPICVVKNAKQNIYGADLLNQELIASARICHPPLTEQQQIADYLDQQTAKIDDLINKQNQLITLLQEKKKSLINHVVTKGFRPQAVMFDTNVFNNLLDNEALLQQLPIDIKYYVTHIQHDEIMRTTDDRRRKKLLDLFNKISDHALPTNGWLLGVSRLGQFKLGSEEDLKELNHLSNENVRHIEDALILLTAKYNNITVVSDDSGTPFKRANKLNYNLINLNLFITTFSLKESGVEWLGDIPKHWQVKKLKYLVQIRDIKQHYSLEHNYIGLENIESWTGKYINSQEEQHIDGLANLCFAGDILFGKLRPYLAKCMISYKENLCSTEILVLKSLQLLGKLLQYYMLSENFINDINSATYGTKMPRVSWDYLSNVKLPLPPLTEQQQIADYLDQQTAKMDQLINKAKAMVALLKEHKQSLINHVVTGKIKVIKDEMKL